MNTVSKTDIYALTAFFNDKDEAEAAVSALMDAGIVEDSIAMMPGNRPDTAPLDHFGFLESLTGVLFHEEQRAAYAEAFQQGGTLVSVEGLNEVQYDLALQILAENGQIEINEPGRSS